MTTELLDRFEAGVAKLLSSLENLRAKHKQLEAEADGLRIHAADRDRMEQRVRELEEQLGTLGAKDEEIARLHTELGGLRGTLDQTRATASRIPQLESEMQDKSKRVSELEWLLGESNGDRESLRGELNELRPRVEDLDARLAEVAEERDHFRAELESTNAQNEEVDGLQATVEDLQVRLDSAIARETQMKDRLHSLIQRIEDTENLLETAELSHGHN